MFTLVVMLTSFTRFCYSFTPRKGPRKVLKASCFVLGFQHLPRDLANVHGFKIMFDPSIGNHYSASYSNICCFFQLIDLRLQYIKRILHMIHQVRYSYSNLLEPISGATTAQQRESLQLNTLGYTCLSSIFIRPV